MTDKVQKIKEWISKEQDGLMDANGNFEYPEHEGAYHILCNLDAYIDSLQEEPVSEDFKQFEETYLDKEKDEILCIYDRHAGLVDGANWQKEQLTAKTVDVTIAIPYPNGDGGYTQLVDSKEALPFGDNIKVLVIKEE